jgi:hypothetical protein
MLGRVQVQIAALALGELVRMGGCGNLLRCVPGKRKAREAIAGVRYRLELEPGSTIVVQVQ